MSFRRVSGFVPGSGGAAYELPKQAIRMAGEDFALSFHDRRESKGESDDDLLFTHG